jgi:PTS system glucose-specific IIC component
LRVELNDVSLASAEALRGLGAAGVVQVGGGMQAVFGTRSENLKTDMEEYMRAGAGTAVPTSSPAVDSAAVREVAVTLEHRALAATFLSALGGAENITRVESCALTRLRVEVRDAGAVDETALEAAGASGVLRISDSVVHVVVGESAAVTAAALDRELRQPAAARGH